MTGPFSQDKAHYLLEEMNLGPDPTLGSCREHNHFASEYPNMPTDKEPDYDDAGPVSLHMMTQDYYPIDSEGEIEYLNWCRFLILLVES